jgi:colicin import membrane protein
MNTQIAKIESVQLEEVVKNAGLQIQEGEEIKQSYLPFLNQLAEIQEQSKKINFESPVAIDETIARKLRLETVAIRTGSEKLKDSRKRSYMLRGNLEQAAYNLIAASCKLTEDVFNNVEKAREIAEKKRKENLRIERLAKINLYSEIEPYGLGDIPDTQFENYLEGLKVAHDARIEAERKAEADRIEKEKKEAAEREAQRLENIRLKKEAEEKEKEMKAQQAKADAERKAMEEKARKEREASELKLKAEREANEKLQAQIKTKVDAEAKAIKEAKEKFDAELKAKQDAEKKAQKAPDKEKLIQYSLMIDGLRNGVNLKLSSPEAQKVLTDAKGLLLKVSQFVTEKANLL